MTVAIRPAKTSDFSILCVDSELARNRRGKGCFLKHMVCFNFFM